MGEKTDKKEPVDWGTRDEKLCASVKEGRPKNDKDPK